MKIVLWLAAILMSVAALTAGGSSLAVALAADPAPPAGTAACDRIVALDSVVQSRTADLSAARVKLLNDQKVAADAQTIADDQTAIRNADTALTVAKGNALGSLCSESTSTPTTTPAPTTVTPRPDDPAVPNRDCGDFANQAEAQRFFVDHGGTASNDVDALDPNHNGVACEQHRYPNTGTGNGSTGSTTTAPAPATTTPAPSSSSTITVNPKSDDGSTASTSGAQVSQVPSGSVDTGGWD